MRGYSQQHPFYGGLDLHARTLSLCLLHQAGEMLWPRPMQARPERLLKALAPSRDALVVAVACLCTWYGRAALGARAGMPGGLGHARALPALHGGQAPNATSAAQTRAVLWRGGRRPPADV